MLLVHSEKVYKVNSWIRQHPGGEQRESGTNARLRAQSAIDSFVSDLQLCCTSSDATYVLPLHSPAGWQGCVNSVHLTPSSQSTDQINISHSKEVVEKQMKPFYVGDIAESEEKVS